MNISFAVLLWMVGAKLNMGYGYFICIFVFTLLHYVKFSMKYKRERNRD